MKARQIKTAAAATTPPIPTSTASSAKPKKIAPLGLAALLLDAAEIAAAGIEHPQHPGIEPRRVRHGEILGDDAVGLHVDQDAAFITALAPAIDNIAARARGRISPHAFLHG
jgi:hypothetical protein